MVQPEGEAAVYCDNTACPAQAERRLRHYVSRGAADIESIGVKLVQRYWLLPWSTIPATCTA